MVPLKSNNVTPKQRWQFLLKKPYFKKISDWINFTKKKTFYHKTLSGVKAFSGIKRFSKVTLYNIFRGKIKYNSYVCYAHAFKPNPSSELSLFQTIYAAKLLLLNTPYYRPGFILSTQHKTLTKTRNIVGQIVPLSIVPLNSSIRGLFNFTNIHATYAICNGSSAIKKKPLKKVKLTFVELPSSRWKLFSVNTSCTMSEALHSFSNKVVEGGWGSGIKNKKIINVRGVAKNPVDHPNGGRTKAKQPELSPWGWIAKFGK